MFALNKLALPVLTIEGDKAMGGTLAIQNKLGSDTEPCTRIVKTVLSAFVLTVFFCGTNSGVDGQSIVVGPARYSALLSLPVKARLASWLGVADSRHRQADKTSALVMANKFSAD